MSDSKARKAGADAPLDKADTMAVIAEAFLKARQGHLPKVAQLYNALVNAIAAGQLAGGIKLPGERELSENLGISLGTAQKSLSLLSRDGQIVREHGRGSFVQADRRPIHELWHYRFRDPRTQEFLPVYAHVLERRLIHETGPWVHELGEDEAGYVEIIRLIDVADQFSCWSTVKLGASRFGRILDLPAAMIANVNLKVLLYREFDAPTIGVRQAVSARPLPGHIAPLIRRPKGEPSLRLEITALTRWSKPVSHQTVVVPSSEYMMELGVENGPSET